jgi:hypothetical protein
MRRKPDTLGSCAKTRFRKLSGSISPPASLQNTTAGVPPFPRDGFKLPLDLAVPQGLC